MTDIPETRDSLIVQVKDPNNREAWEQFVKIYHPVIYRIATGRGMQDADALDLAQQVLMAVAAAIPRWEKAKPTSRFRHWLRRIAKNATLNALTRGPRDRGVGGSQMLELLDELPHPDEATRELVDIECQREIYQRAATIVRDIIKPETWQAFEMTVIHGISIEDAARELNKSTGTVYAARSRVMRRLRETLQKFEEI